MMPSDEKLASEDVTELKLLQAQVEARLTSYHELMQFHVANEDKAPQNGRAFEEYRLFQWIKEGDRLFEEYTEKFEGFLGKSESEKESSLQYFSSALDCIDDALKRKSAM
jgi:hypothetical protein